MKGKYTMGLDCYLYRETFVDYDGYDKKTDEFVQPTVTLKYKNTKNKRLHNRTFKPAYIVEEVGYWRKANHIHRYFVEKCGGGIDECQRIDVSFEDLLKLKNICQKIIQEANETANWDIMAEKLLPTQHGFFFGGVEYDSYYLDDCKRLVDIVNQLEKDSSDSFSSIYYRASW